MVGMALQTKRERHSELQSSSLNLPGRASLEILPRLLPSAPNKIGHTRADLAERSPMIGRGLPAALTDDLAEWLWLAA